MSPTDLPPALPPVDPAASADALASSLSPELLAGLLADGDDELAAWTLAHALEEATRAEVYDGLLAQAMHLVGERWVSGQWGIAEEHLASQTLIRALDRIRPQLGPEGRIGPLAVLAGVTGEHHMIGLICLEHVLGEGGWTVARLGADVPAKDLAGFVARNKARLVAITASDPARLGTVIQAVVAVRDAGPHDIPIMLGGRMGGSPGVAEQTGVDWSGTTLVGAAAFAAGVHAALPPIPDQDRDPT
jgi:methanogenic corrinoid protein MtbC1